MPDISKMKVNASRCITCPFNINYYFPDLTSEDLTLEEFSQLNKKQKAGVYLNALRSVCSAMNIY